MAAAYDPLERERIAHRNKHWVRLATACNSRCLFCLDSDTPRNLFVPAADVEAELVRGRDALGADKVILSGGEASLHPEFHDIVALARSLGYARVQTVTNGWRFAERAFFRAAIQAGLGEITYSLHGDEKALHDGLTRHEGSFERIVLAIARSVREPGLITNVDVVINKRNVGRLDRIVELAISLGVTEFDLLHVIPQAAAFDHKDELFYDVREHLPVLHKVFRLNRHPGFVVWTNRFPVHFLEGLEDLIQDPHKMLDEVNGRRFQVRRALDEGVPLDCRQAERCQHCFIEPFCATVDRTVGAQLDGAVEIWDVGAGPVPDALPFGATTLGLERATVEDALVDCGRGPAGVAVEVRAAAWGAVDDAEGRPVTVVVRGEEQLERAITEGWAERSLLRIELGAEIEDALLAARSWLAARLHSVRLRQPSHERLDEARGADLRDPFRFFEILGLPVFVEGLPPCALGPARFAEVPRRQGPSLFDPSSGRLDVGALAHHHVEHGYRGRSHRCADCVAAERCEGFPIQMVRDQGLKLCRPILSAEDAAFQGFAKGRPSPLVSPARGSPPRGVAPSLPGKAPAGPAPQDPLATLAASRDRARAARRLTILG